jgi:small subunit ribosomal protein S12
MSYVSSIIIVGQGGI